MRKSFIYTTESNNSYLYDVQHSFSILVHPELIKIHEGQKGDQYYLRKYEYLKQQGFFNIPQPIDYETTLDESIIEKNIIQARQIVFETTDHCNLKCPYCSLGELYEFAKTDSKNINTADSLKLLKYIFNVKPEKTNLMIGFFGGEPLVNFKFIKLIVDTAKQLNEYKQLKLVFNMTTNATLIHKYIDFIVKNEIRLLISLDGDEKGHSYRVFAKNNESSFKRVIYNIDIIKNKYPKYFENYVEFNTVLHDRNSVKDVFKFIYNRYNKIPIIAQLNTEFVNHNKKELFEQMFNSKWKSEEEYQENKSDLWMTAHPKFEKYRELRKFVHDYSINYYMSNLLYLLYNNVKPIPTGTCSPFSRKIYLNTNSELLPCEKVAHTYQLGKVNNDVDINIERISQKYKYYYDRIQKKCVNCYAGKFCSVCMFTISDLDKLEMEDFSCFAFQDEKKFSEKLKRVFSFLEKNPIELFEITDNLMIK